ncbi:MAG: class I SAM-dependent methyltransferase [Candidatus Pacearchaeota archaeon]
MNQRKVWDKIAPQWNKYKIESPTIIKDFLSKCSGKVLDLGCGSGRNFHKFNGVIYGVDFSSQMLKFAKENSLIKGLNNIVLIKSKASKLPFENNFFDAVLCIALIHCVKYQFIRKKIIKEMYRVMKPEAKALVTVWDKNAKRFKNKPKRIRVPWTIGDKKVYRSYYLYDADELRKELEEVGFRVLKRIEPSSNIIFIIQK